MKKQLIVAGVLAMGFFSCQHNSLEDIVTRGDWTITSFTEHGTDETSHFSAYTFAFDNNGTVTATTGSSTTTGTWSEGRDDGHRKFFLEFPAGALDELNEDWVIDEKSDNTIRLKDDNVASDEHLVFTKQ